MDLSNKIKNLGYSIEKDALVYFKSKLIGVCSNNNEIEELIIYHNNFDKNKSNLIPKDYKIMWRDKNSVYLYDKNSDSLIGSVYNQDLQNVIKEYENFKNNRFHINLNETQLKDYSLIWRDIDSCYLITYQNGDMEVLSIIYNNNEIDKSIDKYLNQNQIIFDFDFD